MKILFVHQNFPGQFKHLAPAMVELGHQVVAFCMKDKPFEMKGVRVVTYKPGKSSTKGVHPWASDFETKVIRGAVAFKAAKKMRDEYDFTPDIIIAHPGWGESLFLKEAWPKAKVLLFCEWYYGETGDYVFDPEFQKGSEDSRCRVHSKNAHNLLSMDKADGGFSPTFWQRSTYPQWFQDKIHVVHDGVDTEHARPVKHRVSMELKIPEDIDCGIEQGSVTLAPDDELITFVNRNLEPYRGYHVFMRMLPELLRRRPRAKVVIVGGNKNSYGSKPETGSWKQRFLEEVRSDLDMSRVHFVGKIPYSAFIRLLQMSTVHVYHTYPFVLSWSLLEAMACGCAIVASDCPPVKEAITTGETGRLVDFFDTSQQVDTVCELLDDPQQRKRLGQNARKHVVETYDLNTVCLPQQLEYINRVVEGI